MDTFKKTAESQLRAVKKYQEKFIDMKLRVLPEYHEKIVKHAEKYGDASTTAFLKRAIEETMANDLKSEIESGAANSKK